MEQAPDLNQPSEQQLRKLAGNLLAEVQQKDRTIERIERQNNQYQLQNEQYKHELAILRRHRFARKSEILNTQQRSLLDELVEEDLAGVEEEIGKRSAPSSEAKPKQQPKRKPLPVELPRTVITHEPEDTRCSCGCQMKRIGEDISEKLDYVPGTFTVERHVRGKWVCEDCETLTQAPVPPQVIDKGVPAPGLLAQVLVAKYGDHLPLYRQETIFARAGVEIPRSTLADWVGRCGVALQPLVDALRERLHQQAVIHADETPVAQHLRGHQHGPAHVAARSQHYIRPPLHKACRRLKGAGKRCHRRLRLLEARPAREPAGVDCRQWVAALGQQPGLYAALGPYEQDLAGLSSLRQLVRESKGRVQVSTSPASGHRDLVLRHARALRGRLIV